MFHKHFRPVIIAVGEYRRAVAFLFFGDDHFIAVTGENINHRFDDIGIDQIAGTAGEIADASFASGLSSAE